jgi:hypothetical protein
VWAAGKLFWYLQREFLSLMREFSGGKLKQKGFFHSAGKYDGQIHFSGIAVITFSLIHKATMKI